MKGEVIKMKIKFKQLFLPLFTGIIITASTFFYSSDVIADEESSSPVSFNVGYASEYWYRGVYQSESSVSFGADYEAGGFYLGTWWADVDQGLEHDYYAGYSMSAGGADIYFGVTGYYYTDNFDSDYEEFNVGISFGAISVDYADGKYKTATDDSYSHTTVSVDMSSMGLPITLTYGDWGGSTLKGDWFSASYSTNIQGVDVGLEVAKNSDDITAAETKRADTSYAVFSLGYSF
tara:strand:+ start:350 stop:1051 length:702 start_codon:yes stop_codon:yes gene_type:complete